MDEVSTPISMTQVLDVFDQFKELGLEDDIAAVLTMAERINILSFGLHKISKAVDKGHVQKRRYGNEYNH